MRPGIDRRTFLGRGAAGLLAAGIPGCSGRGAATPGVIDHVVVVMMENRSFDHFLGSLSLLEGRDDVDGLLGTETNPSSYGGEVQVFPLDVSCQADPHHGWDPSHAQFDGGANDGFVQVHEASYGQEEGARVMGYHTRDDLPVTYALASRYAIADRWFCSVMGPTWPNRFFAQAGTSQGRKSNDISEGPLTARNIYQALGQAGIDWTYYYTDFPFLGFFADTWDPSHVGMLEDFVAAAGQGSLPAFSWVDPGFSYNDDHPPHHPGLGEMFLAVVHEALATSPLWDRCLLLVTFDEHGGFFDHVPPPTIADDLASEGFDQLGFRIPAIAVGPWVRQGVTGTVLDHCSMLRYLCERFGLSPWTTRIRSTNSAECLLDRERMASGVPLEPAVLPFFEVAPEDIGPECSTDIELRAIGPAGARFLTRAHPGAVRADPRQLLRTMRLQARRLGLRG